jgi:hypothetical protein
MNSLERKDNALMPRQHMPVTRAGASTRSVAGVQPSDLLCDLCRFGCDRLSGIAKQLCLIACNETVCKL